jgi:hypothetical protein
MSYKRIRVWSGSEWLEVGAQVPGVVDASGTGTVTLGAGGTASTSLAFGSTFVFPPFVFVQVTGVNHATVAVTADAVGFTAEFVGEASDVITFNWFAVQVDFS